MKKIITLFSLMFMASFAHALEYKHVVNEKGTILLFATGDIVAGDADRLHRQIQKFQQKSVVVVLESGGGLVSEAIKLGHVIYDTDSRTAVDTHCASACALVFFAGHERYLTHNAKVGVHQLKSFGAKPDEASAQYWTSKVYEYADDVNLPKNVLHLMFKTRHETMHYLSQAEAKSAKVSYLNK